MTIVHWHEEILCNFDTNIVSNVVHPLHPRMQIVFLYRLVSSFGILCKT